MVDAALLRARVETTNVPQASQELAGFGRQIDQTGTRARDAQGRFAGFNQGIEQSGRSASTASRGYRELGLGIQSLSPVALTTTGAIVGVGVAAQKSVQASIEWESSLAGVAKTLDVTGLSAEEAQLAVADIGTELRQMAANDIPVAVTELAAIAETAGQLGIARDDVLAFTEVMAKLAVTTDLTSDAAATSFAQFLNVTGSATDTVDNLASSLVFLGNNSATTESKILNMATRIASAGSQAGLSDAQILGLAAALSSLGLEAEAGGTAASQVLIKINEAAIEGGEALENFADVAGVSAEQFAAAWQSDPQAAIAAFFEGLARIEDEGGNTVAIFDELELSGIRVTDTMRRVSGDVDLLTTAMDGSTQAAKDNSAANAEAAVRFDTTASKIQLANNRMNEAAITAGDELVPAYVALVDVGADLTESLSEQAVAFGQLRDAMTQLDPTALGEEYVNAILLPFTAGPDIIIGLGNALFGLGDAQNEAKAAGEGNLPVWENTLALLEQTRDELALTGPTWEEYLSAQEGASHQAVAANRAHMSLINTMNLEIDTAAELAAEWDMQALHALTLEDAALGLAGAYQQALAVQSAFQSQGSEFASTQRAIEDAVAAVQDKQTQGIPLTEKEISLLENHEEAIGRLVGGQQDATVEAGLAALAASELMLAQDELNRAIENGVEDLGPYKQRVEDAQAALGNMGSAAGETQSAQDDLAASINGPLITAIGDLTRSVEYISKPWLIEIDAATDAAEREVERLKGIIAAGAILPISIVSGDASGLIPGGGVANFASGGISEGGMAVVGEQGPELVFLPRGSQVMSHGDSQRFLGGFADGTGSLGAGGGINVEDFGDFREPFIDIGTQIAQAIQFGIEKELIESGIPTGAEYAQALIDGATDQIDTDGDKVLDAWIVVQDRIPELATGIGQDTVIALLEQYAALQGELELAILSGTDTGEIQAQLDAIFALFAAWSGNSVDEVEAVWDAITDEAKAAEAQAVWETLFGSIQMPGPTLSFDLDDLLSGDAQQDLQAAGEELWALFELYSAAGMTDAANAVLEQIAALDLQDKFVDEILGTDTGQQLMDEFAAQLEAAEAEEAAKAAAEAAKKVQEAIWDTILSVPIEELASGEFIDEQQKILEQLYEDLSIAKALGLDEQVEEIQQAIAEQEDLLAAAGEAMGTPIVEGVAASLDEIATFGDAAMAEMMRIFEDYPDIALGMVDDLIKAVQDGHIPFEQAMQLLADIPEKDLLPALERLEEQVTADLAQALLEFGPDSPEVQAILASLDLIADAAGAADDALSEIPDSLANLPGSKGYQAPGDQSPDGSGSGGGGSTQTVKELGPGGTLDDTMLALVNSGTTLSLPKSQWHSVLDALGATVYIDEDGLRRPSDNGGFELYGSPGNYYVNPFADGGIVTQPTLAYIGEAGETEGVFPLSRAQEFGFGGMDDDTIRKFARAFADELRRAPIQTNLDGRAIAGGMLHHLGSAAIQGQAMSR